MKTIKSICFFNSKDLKKCLLAFIFAFSALPLYANVGFYMDVNQGCTPLTVNFTNTSTSGNYFIWDMDDGTEYTDSFHVKHVYLEAGWYFVALQAYDTSGGGMVPVGNHYDFIIVDGALDNFFHTAFDSVCPGELIEFDIWYDFITLEWDFGDGRIVTDQEYVTHSYSSAGTYKVVLQIETECGLSEIIDTIIVSSNVKPVAEFANYPESLCPGEIMFFEALNWGYLNYNWDFGDGNLKSGRYVQHKFDEAGNYDVILKVNNYCGNIDSVSKQVIVDENILISEAIDFYYPPEACPNSFVNFSAPLFYEMVWDFGDGSPLVKNVQYPSHRYTDTGVYEVKLQIKNGCGDEKLITNHISIVDDLPIDWAYFFVYPEEACPGETINFGYYAEGISSLEWNFGDGNTSEEFINFYSYTNAGFYDISLTMYNGCGFSVTLYDQVFIDDNLYPDDFEFGAIPEHIACQGDNIVFYSIGGTSYEWDFGDGNSTDQHISIEIEPGFFVDFVTHTYNSEGNYDVTLTYTNHCGNSNQNTFNYHISNNIPVSGEFWWVDAPDFYGYEVCNEVRFFALGGGQFEWDFGDGTQLTTSSFYVSHEYKYPGSYLVEVIISNSCGNSQTLAEMIHINDLNLKFINWSEPDSLLQYHKACETITFQSAGGESYIWNFGDGSDPVTTDNDTFVYEYEDEGVYEVNLTIVNACGGETVLKDEITIEGPCEQIGIEKFNFDLKNSLFVYPNPVHNQEELSIKFKLNASSFVNASVYDLTGRELAVLMKNKHSAGIHNIKFKAVDHNIKAGIYLLKIQTLNGSETVRLSVY